MECRLQVMLKPGAKRDAIGISGRCALNAWVTAPPVEGKANRRLINVLAEKLGVRKSAVSIAKGVTSRRKGVRIQGIGWEEVERRLREDKE